MKITELIDLIQRRVNSVLFRFVLSCYSIFLVVIEDNIFSNWLYGLIIIIYFVLYIILLKKPVLRLTNDFLFIGLILIGKNPNESYNYLLMLLPIINSINFSGDKKSPLLYVYSFILYITLICQFKQSDTELSNIANVKYLIPILFLWIINVYTSLRVKIRNFRESLNDVVDGFYLNKEYIKRPHKIYTEIIEAIHKHLNKELIVSLYCFTPLNGNQNKLIIVNGSSFLWKYEFKNKEILKKLREKKVLVNEEIFIEEEPKNLNLILYSKVEDQEYFFVFITNSNVPIYYMVIGFFRTLEPAFSKISKVLLSEKRLQEVRNEELQRLTESSQYVNRANKTMHFIRNRLSPFSNLLKMLDNLGSVPSEKTKAFEELLKGEKERTKIELKNIVDRANDMLEKSNNPFIYTSLVPISIQRIYTILKRIFAIYFPEIVITINITPDGIKRYANLNEEGFEIFLSDWINNMKKYKKSLVSCHFHLENELLSISFKNDHNKNTDEISKMIDDLTSNDRNEIMKRTTHGLFIIKSTLEDMKVPFELKNVSEQHEIIFTLNLKTFEYESSSI